MTFLPYPFLAIFDPIGQTRPDLGRDVVVILHRHPHQRWSCNGHWAQEAIPEPRCSENQPFAREMEQSDSKCPHCQLVEMRVVEVISAVKTDD